MLRAPPQRLVLPSVSCQPVCASWHSIGSTPRKGQAGNHSSRVGSVVQCSAVSAVAEENLQAGNSNGVHTLRQAQPACAAGHLSADGTAFLEEHRVRGYEVGPDQKTTILTMANLLQEVAGNHSVALWGRTDAGYATDPIMVERHLIFAATRIQIRMEDYPRWGDLVQIETWFQEEGRVAACRNWIIRNVSTRQEIGRATSTWVMVNTLTRKLAKMPDEMRAKMEYLAPHPSRDAIPPGQARLKIPDIAIPAEIEGPMQVARRSDMDMNGHINNVTYLGWALETVPEDIYLNYSLYQVEVDYKAECMAGDKVESLGSRVEYESQASGTIKFVHLLRKCDESGCHELVRARTTWRPDYGQAYIEQ